MDDAPGISTAQARQLSILWTKAYPIVSTYFRAALSNKHKKKVATTHHEFKIAEPETSTFVN